MQSFRVLLPLLVLTAASCAKCTNDDSNPPAPQITFVPGDVLSLRAQPRTTHTRNVAILNETNADIKLISFDAFLQSEDTPSVLFGVDLDES